ncbi:hypothetical protein CAEBREN_04987 [Caenorhabditis brenneri]|uniref:C-type lectin domain-containing protein n=1 Tax=Caenorhabditis brenneri TaxID=135651 RepID=G0MEV5_CAEBE|nr:hypothetical protein CAEBREN_04987 [Caenorhabditis brenneri]
MQKLIISAFIVALVAGDCNLQCPSGYMSFKRTPTAANGRTSLWCVKVILPDEPVNITSAKALCKQDGSVLTTFENEDERLQLADALIAGLKEKQRTVGAMFLDGHRTSQCETQDMSVLKAAPCNNPATAFETDDKHTDTTFMLQSWAHTEPGGTFYEKEIESCIQLGISQFERRDKKINDILCNYAKSPTKVTASDLWNFGAACGRLPDFQ